MEESSHRPVRQSGCWSGPIRATKILQVLQPNLKVMEMFFEVEPLKEIVPDSGSKAINLLLVGETARTIVEGICFGIPMLGVSF